MMIKKSFPGLHWAVAGTLRDHVGGGCYSSDMVTLASNFFPGLTQEPTLPPVLPDQPHPGMRIPPALPSACPRNLSPSASQREYQALQDLMDLAREGLSASPLPCSGGPAESGGTTGETQDGTPEPAPPSGPSTPCDQDGEGSSDLRFPGSSPYDGEQGQSLSVLSFFLKGECDTGKSITVSLNFNQGQSHLSRTSGQWANSVYFTACVPLF